MTTSGSKDLPPHWIVKTSRQYPTLSYYANVKTGQSSWRHPSLLKESELKNFNKKKGKKKLRENDSELKKASDVEDQSKSPKKGKFTPICSEPSVASNDNNGNDQSKPIKFTIKKKNVLTFSKTDSSPKKNAGLHPSIILAKKIATRDLWSNVKRKVENDKEDKQTPDVQSAKKMKSNKEIDTPTTSKSHLKIKEKHMAQEISKSISTDEKNEAEEISKSISTYGKNEAEEISKSISTYGKNEAEEISKSISTYGKNEAEEISKSMSTDGNNKAEEISNSISTDGKNKRKSNKEPKYKTHKVAVVESLHVLELSGHHGDKERTDKYKKDTKKIKNELSGHHGDKERTNEYKKDKKKIKNEEDDIYYDFIKRKSSFWKNNRYRLHEGESKKTIKPELHRDENHSEIMPPKMRPKEEEEEEKAPISLKQVPYVNSPQVSEPVPVQTEDNIIYPKVSDMEIDEQELNMEIANFRGSASYSCLAINEGLSKSSTCLNSTSLYFVVDTNVLISDIDILQELKSSLVDGRESVVVVPYVALQEMDWLKKNASLGEACRAAVRWCNRHFEKRHPRVQGQTYSNYRTTVEENKRASADDLVRDCCLLLVKEGLDVCLLTNDVNLRNKALMSNLSAFSANDLRNKLGKLSARHVDTSEVLSKCEESNMKDISLNEVNRVVNKRTSSIRVSKQRKDRSNQKARSSMTSEDMMLERITTSLHHTLSNILQDVMKETYEDLWLTIVIHKPPWKLNELFACWEKHWIAAMTDKFPSRMKELLAEINNLLSSHVDAQKLLSRVELLYSYFKSTYSKHILPVQDPSSVVVDMSEASASNPTCSTPPPVESLGDPHQSSALGGAINVEKMINQVGAHITHIVALVLTAFGMQHNLQTLSNISGCELLSPDNARTSGINLHKVIMSLGTAIARCLNEKTSSALQELGHMLVNFWSEAHLPCPDLPFMECDLRHFVENPICAHYLGCVLQELESLVQHLTQVISL